MPSTIRDLTELTAVAVDDYFLVSDTSDVTNRDKRISQANLISNAAKKTGTPVLNRVASWLDANTVQDAGFLVADIARLSQSQTFAGAPTINGLALLVGGLHSGAANLATASFAQFTPPAVAGIMIVWCTNSSQVYGIVMYRTGAYINTMLVGANMTVINGALNGTTGTAGKAAIGMAGSDLYIENQLGAARLFNYLFLV